MTKAKISEYDAVAANNTDVNGVNIDEGCAPSGMNNMGREIMAALKRFQTGSDSDGVTVGGNLVVSGTVTAANTATLGNVDVNGGTIDGTAIGGASAAAGSFTTLGASSTATLNTLSSSGATLTGGTINGIAIGGSTPAAGSFTTLNTSGQVVFNDAGADVDFRVESDTVENALFVDGASGNVGFGTSSPTEKLTVAGAGLFSGALVDDRTSAAVLDFSSGVSRIISYGASGTGGIIAFRTASGGASSTERMRIDSSGNVGIGTTSPAGRLDVEAEFGGLSEIRLGGTAANATNFLIAQGITGVSNGGMEFRDLTNSATRMSISGAGAVNVVGAFSKGSGSFKIDHPLKSETHYLVHSFIEGPQADNIYRGKVELVAGRAEVNIDTVADMTEGTFVALNREVQCFTSNESDWDAVRGSVTGNILTIECQNAESTATISWLVIGERQDQHMYDTDWTDENGKVIVEPLKPVKEEVEPTDDAEDAALENA